MKNVLLTFVAATLSVSAAFAGGMPNKEKVNAQIEKMKRIDYVCKETAMSKSTNNSVLICQNEDAEVRLFKIQYSVIQTGSRCGASITAESLEEI